MTLWQLPKDSFTSIHPKMKPEILFLLACLFIPQPGPALVIKGTTQSGMRFHGSVISTDVSTLKISNFGAEQSLMIGIPYADIQTIQLPADGSESPILADLALHKQLLPLLDADSLQGIMAEVHDLGVMENWPELYQWTVLLLASNPQWGFGRSLKLWQAWAYFEMNLIEEASHLLEELVADWDPLQAPVLLCWLMAQLEKINGAHSRALYWSLLPSVQIPASIDSLAGDLERLTEQWMSESP